MEKISLGICGMGRWGNKIEANTYFNNCWKVRSFDKNSPHYSDWSDIYSELYNNLIISTPPDTHFKLAKKALNSNCNVWIEKPMCKSYEQALELKRLADMPFRKVMVGHILMYHPMVKVLKLIIDDNIKHKKYHDIHIQNLYQKKDMRENEESVLWNIAPHEISLVVYWLPYQPISYKCEVSPDKHSCNICLDYNKFKVTILINRNYHTNIGRSVRLVNGDNVHNYELTNIPLLQEELRAFYDYIVYDKKPIADINQGCEVVRIIEELERSNK